MKYLSLITLSFCNRGLYGQLDVYLNECRLSGTMFTFAPHAAQKYGFDRYSQEK